MLGAVQGKILAMISGSEGLRYSEAYPGEGIDDDLYNYHLQELVRRGYVEKINQRYRLTESGKKEITHFNAKGEELGRFHLVTILIVMRHERKEILLHKRKVHPHRGEISTVSGNVLAGEKILVAAKRRLKEETGLEAEFEHWGNFRAIRKTMRGDLFEDMIFCVCTTEEPRGVLVDENKFGENWWGKFEEIYKYYDQDTAIAEVEKKMAKMIQNGEKWSGPMEEEVTVLRQV